MTKINLTPPRWTPALALPHRSEWESKSEDAGKLYHKRCDAYLPEDAAFCPLCGTPAPLPTLDHGNYGWTIPGTGCWGDKEWLVSHVSHYHGMTEAEAKARLVEDDTRPTLGQIFDRLRHFEKRCCGQDCGKNHWGGEACLSTGPWDEYFGLDWEIRNPGKLAKDSKLPNYWRLIVFAVKGSSEGIYLHVGYLHEGNYTNLITGKTCAGLDAWDACHESVARMNYFLNW